LPRSIIESDDRGHPWRLYPHFVEVEQAFKRLKNDLSIHPIDRQLETRIEAHDFVACPAYCLPVALKRRLSRRRRD
jgi:transposase